MSDIFRYISGHMYEPEQKSSHQLEQEVPDLIYQVRLKIVVKKLLGKKDVFSDTLETLMYSFDMKLNHNGELVATGRRDGVADPLLQGHPSSLRQSNKHPLKK